MKQPADSGCVMVTDKVSCALTTLCALIVARWSAPSVGKAKARLTNSLQRASASLALVGCQDDDGWIVAVYLHVGCIHQ
jgi:hypothetical protein